MGTRQNPEHHGMTKTPEYSVWESIWTRCKNPKAKSFAKYGGRGIELRFANFSEFYAAIGPRPSRTHSVDRINNDGHYEAGNVRWATQQQQARNRRSNRWITWRGETRTLAEWAERLGFSTYVIWTRLRCGRFSLDRALTEPLNKTGKQDHRNKLPLSESR